MGMTPHPTVYRRNNRRFLATLNVFDQFRLSYRDHQTGLRSTVTMKFLRVEGDDLVCLDATDHERRFALGYVSCSKYQASADKKKREGAATAHRGE